MSGPSRNPARPSWLVPVVVIALAAAVSGGIAARGYYRTDADPAAVGLPVDSGQDGSTAVRLTPDALLHPERDNVQRLLQNHFDAINQRSYWEWARTVTEQRVTSKPESVWRAEYRSTRDTDAVVYRISGAGTGKLRILLRFTSKQDPGDAPEAFARPCIRWRMVYGLTADDGVWKVDAGLSSGTRPWDPC